MFHTLYQIKKKIIIKRHWRAEQDHVGSKHRNPTNTSLPGTEGQRDRGTGGQRDRGTVGQGQRDRGAGGPGDRGRERQREEVVRHPRTLAPILLKTDLHHKGQLWASVKRDEKHLFNVFSSLVLSGGLYPEQSINPQSSWATLHSAFWQILFLTLDRSKKNKKNKNFLPFYKFTI